MNAIVLYDEYCNFCVFIVSILRLLKRLLHKKNTNISFIPLQEHKLFAKSYGLDINDLQAEVHLLEAKNKVYRGNLAIAELGKYFPELSIVLNLFKTKFGKHLYKLISLNRHKIFGCNTACSLHR